MAAVSNTIAPRFDYVAIQDAAYKAGALTSILDTPAENIRFMDANKVSVRKVTTGGLHTHGSANNKTPITSAWNDYQLDYDREAILEVDAKQEQDGGQGILADAIVEFVSTQAVPEKDAYTFAKLAGEAITAGHGKEETLAAKGDYRAAFEAALLHQTKNGCTAPASRKIAFVDPDVNAGLRGDYDRMWTNEGSVSTDLATINGVRIVEVPGLFATSVTLGDGTFTKTPTTGKDINFMIVDPAAVVKVDTYNYGKFFDDTVWQANPGHAAYQYRNIAGAFLRADMTAGVYVSYK